VQELLESFFNYLGKEYVSIFGVMAGAMFVISWATKLADKKSDKVLKARVSEELLNVRKSEFSESIIPNFNFICDRFFGEKHFTLKCFFRSSVISLLLFSTLSYCFNNIEGGFEIAYDFLLICISANLIADMLSLFTTRKIIKLNLNIYLKLIIDLFVSWLLITMMYFILRVFWGLFYTSLEIVDLINLSHLKSAFSVFFFNFEPDLMIKIGDEERNFYTTQIALVTTFSTSVWLWLHALSELTIKFFNRSLKFLRWLNVRDAPFDAIGTVVCIWVGVLLASLQWV